MKLDLSKVFNEKNAKRTLRAGKRAGIVFGGFCLITAGHAVPLGLGALVFVSTLYSGASIGLPVLAGYGASTLAGAATSVFSYKYGRRLVHNLEDNQKLSLKKAQRT